MTTFAGHNRYDHLEPPLRMDGVVYSQVALRTPFPAAPPTADEWRLYIVRSEGVVLEAGDLATGPTRLQRGTVIGLSGNIHHAFASANHDDVPLVKAEWVETPLGVDTAKDDALIAISRIPQSSKPFVSLLQPFIRIDPSDYPENH